MLDAVTCQIRTKRPGVYLSMTLTSYRVSGSLLNWSKIPITKWWTEGGREVGREREPVYYWYKGQVISALMLGIIGYWGSIRVHR